MEIPANEFERQLLRQIEEARENLRYLQTHRPSDSGESLYELLLSNKRQEVYDLEMKLTTGRTWAKVQEHDAWINGRRGFERKIAGTTIGLVVLVLGSLLKDWVTHVWTKFTH